MRSENFAAAWALADDDLRSGNLSTVPKHEGPRHRQRIWRGEQLRGKRVLVRCYHGLGDTIQFSRFLPQLREIASEVIFWCQGELIPLMGSLGGIDIILPLHDGAPEAEYDVDIEIMELGHALRIDRGQIAWRFPYLSAPASEAVVPRGRPGELLVGLIWQAGDWDRRRSIPTDALRPLTGVPGIRLYSLQHGPARELAPQIPADDLGEVVVADLAAQLIQFDLLITVDSMPAHLAGALKRDVWTVLHADCDWRWPRTGACTIWYPTMRLFHQREPDRWEAVIADVSRALAERSHDTRNGRHQRAGETAPGPADSR